MKTLSTELQALTDYWATFNLPSRVVSTGHHTRDNTAAVPWECNGWRLTCKRWNFDYFTGLAVTERPTPAEIIGAVARDAVDAGSSFEEWASEFGYDTDSRKAEVIYVQCRAGFQKLWAIGLLSDQIEKLAELASEL